MPIDDEVTIRRLLVLADTRLKQRCVFQGREAEADVFTNGPQSLGTDGALAICGIELRSLRIISDFESASIVARNSVVEMITVIGPDREMWVGEVDAVTRQRAKKEHILLRRANQIANCLGKQSAHPGSTSKNVRVRGQVRVVRQHYATIVSRRRFPSPYDRDLSIFASCFDERVNHGSAAGAGIEVSAFGLEDTPFNALEVDLRPSFSHFRCR